MIEIEDIVDGESLESWLLQQPEEVQQHYAVVISSRVALRELPEMWRWVMQMGFPIEAKLTVVNYLRCDLISVVACRVLGLEIVNAAKMVIDEGAVTTFSAAEASFIAGYSVIVGVTAIEAIVFSYKSSFPQSWFEIQNDCQGLLAGNDPEDWPLWQNDADPMANIWDEVLGSLGPSTKDWQFWIDWYEAVLHGKPQNADLLYDVALIDDDVWKQGLEAVNAAIADIQVKHALLATPNGEVMSINQDTGRLRVDVVSGMPRDHLQENVEKLENVLDLFDLSDAGGNQYLSLSAELKIINKAVQKYSQRPRMLHSACVRVERRMRVKIDNGECPEPEKDANVSDFVSTVQAVSVDLFTRDPQVKEAANHASMAKLPELTEELVETLFKAASEIEDHAEDELQAEMVARVRDMLDETLSGEERKEAFYITSSRVFRALALLKKRATSLNGVVKSIVGFVKNSTTLLLWLEKAYKLLLEFFT